MITRQVPLVVIVLYVCTPGAAGPAVAQPSAAHRSAASKSLTSARQAGSHRSAAPSGGDTNRRPVSSRNAAPAGVLTANWIGPATGGLWSDPANWDTVEFPNNGNGALTYNVVIISEIFDPTVINLDTHVEIGALFLRGTLDAQSGPANLVVNGLFELQGSLLGPGTTTAKGGMIDPTLSATINIGGGRVLENAGTATFRTPAGINIIGGSQLNNLAGGAINLQTFVLTNTGGELNNFGLLFTETCCHNTQGVFHNYGVVDVRTGASLTIFSTGTHRGEFRVAQGSTLSFEAELGTVDFTATSDITGSGNVLFGSSFGISATTMNVSGRFSLTGTATVAIPVLNFANAPTSAGFTLDIPGFSGLPSVVSFESGLPSLIELTLASRRELRVLGDANVSGPVLWDGTMSGTGTTTTDGPVRAVRGLTLDGRRLIANGGFLWQGSDFVLDNGALFENATGSTWDIELSRRIRLITTDTPLNPGRIINSGLVTQTASAPAHVMTDWQQTATGVTNAESLSFFGNTDISGTVIVPAGFRSTMTFAGPDTGTTISHRLNADSTLMVQGTVSVGEQFALGADIIDAEFGGTMDFTDSSATLEVRGANTTLILPLRTNVATPAARGGGQIDYTALDIFSAGLVLYDETTACCHDDGTCIEVPTFSCRGKVQARGSRCDTAACGFGACCFGDSSCSLFPNTHGLAACIAAGGNFLGPGSVCDSCNPGACCLPDASCTVESLSVCNLDGGRFLGQNSSCTPDSCTGGQTSLAVSIGNLVLDDARLVINTPTGNGASSVSAGTLILRGDSSVEGVGGAKVVVDADGCIFGFGATSTLNNVCETVTGPGPCELGFGTAVHLQEGASLAFDGRGGTVPNACFVGPGFAIDSADGTGSLAADFVDFLLGETTDPTTPSQTIDVPFVATNSNVTASCSGCPGRANAQFLSGLTLEGTCGFDGVDVTVQPGLTIGPDGVWTLTDANVLTGTLDNETVMSTVLTSSTLAIQVLSLSSAAIGGKTLSLQDSQVRFLNADGTSELGSLTGTITLSKDILENPPQIPFVVTINAFVSTTTVKSGTILAPGDTISAPGGIGTATISADEVVVEPGTVLEVDIDPTNAVDPNDVLQFVSGGATVGTNMRIFLKSESECGIAPPDAFTIVTGTAITYPNGGDGRRILTAGGEGSFVVNQGPTGIVLDGFLLGADINGDRAVDDADAHLLIPCLAGPGEPHSPGCDTSDLDFDADTDLKDFSVIQNGFGTTCP